MSRNKQRSTNESSYFGKVMPEILFVTVAFGFISTVILILNQGVNAQARSEPRANFETLLAELELDRDQEVERLQQVLADLNAERINDAKARRTQGEDAKKFVAHTEGMRQQIGGLKDQVERTEEQVNAERTNTKAAEGRLAKLRDARRVRVIFVIDVSGSMAEGILEIQHTLTAMSETMPAALTSFEVGVIAYRDDKLITFKLRQLNRDGEQLQKLKEFLDGLEAVNGETCIAKAISEAITTLQGSHNPGSDIIVLTADVGPGDVTSGYNQTAGNELIATVQGWVNAAPTSHRFLAFLTKPAPGISKYSEYAKHRPFFERLGDVSTGSQFSTRLSSMFPIVFEAAFPEE